MSFKRLLKHLKRIRKIYLNRRKLKGRIRKKIKLVKFGKIRTCLKLNLKFAKIIRKFQTRK